MQFNKYLNNSITDSGVPSGEHSLFSMISVQFGSSL